MSAVPRDADSTIAHPTLKRWAISSCPFGTMRLMVEQKLLGVDQGPDDVLVALLFAQLGIGFSILILRLLPKVIQGQFQFLRLGLAGVNRVIKFADFDRIFPLRVL